MKIEDITSIIRSFPRQEQIQIAVSILENIKTETSIENEWLTEPIQHELMKRREQAVENVSTLLSHSEVVV